MRIFTMLFLLFTVSGLSAEAPEWISHLPFSDDAFWGVGKAESREKAEILAKKEILMQMSSQVEALITMETGNSGQYQEVTENLKLYFSSNSLRGAEFVEEYKQDQNHWVLMKYCDTCGDSMIKSALLRFEEIFDYDSRELIQNTSRENISKAYMVERRLKELQLEDFNSEDILVRFSGMKIIIMIVNFIPYKTELSDSQKKGLAVLSHSLLEELKALNYKTLDLVGHANPTGEENEINDLQELSKVRALTMQSYLSSAGLNISSVNWKGGDNIIGDISTPLGRGLNRRVEIIVNFEQE